MHYHLVLNPFSNNRKSIRALLAVEKYLSENNFQYTTHITSNAKDAALIFNALSIEPVTIIVLGGDGTLHNMLNSFANFDNITFGLIPCGSGNDFAKPLGLSTNPVTAIKDIINGKTVTLDAMRLDNRFAINVVGTGLDIEVLKRYQKMKFFKGKLRYYIALLATLRKFSSYHLDIEIDGKTYTRDALLIAVCNGQYIGGGMRVNPYAKPDDALLNVTIANRVPKSKLLPVLLKFIKGKHDKCRKYVESYTCSSVKVKSHEPMLLQADGEILDIPFDCEIIKEKLKFIVPQNY